MKNARTFGLLAVVVAVLAGCGGTTPPPAANPNPAEPEPPTVPDTAACVNQPETLPSLEVSANTVCLLSGTVIQGDVTVAAGGDLTGISLQIGGSVRSEGAASVSLETSDVTGSVLINGGTSAEIVDSNVGGDVQLIGSSSSASISGTTVEGNLEVSRNGGDTFVDANIISGNLICEGNGTVPEGSENLVAGNSTGQCADLLIAPAAR